MAGQAQTSTPSRTPGIVVGKHLSARSYACGFTVVELVTTIVLLAILSGVALNSFVSPSAFEPSTLVHQLKLEFNLAHGYATARQDAEVEVMIFADSASWRAQTSNSLDGIIRDTSVDAFNSVLTVTDGTTSGAVSNTSPLTIAYAGTGAIAQVTLGGTPLDLDQGIQWQVVGDSARTLCLHPTGYLDENPCN